MTDTPQLFDAKYQEILAQLPTDLSSEEAINAMKAFKTFTESAPQQPEPEPVPDPVPTTRSGRTLAFLARALDNETTRTAIKVGGSLGTVGFVTWATLHKDAVIERQALAQANTPPLR